MAVPVKLPIPSPDEFRASLRRHGLKATRQRMAVHAVMSELVHATAEEVTETLRQRGASVTQTSVYNILNQLSDNRIYSRRNGSGNKMVFDVRVRPHVHLYDRENNYYRDVVDEELVQEVNAHLKRRRFKGYTIECIDIQFIVRPTGRGKKSSV